MTDTLTTKQAAKLAGVTFGTISVWHREGRIEAELVNRALQINRASLEAWIAERPGPGCGFKATFDNTPPPDDKLDALQIAEKAGVSIKTSRNRLAVLRKRGTIEAVRGESVRARMWYYEPEVVPLVRDFKPAKPVDHVSHAVKVHGAQGAQDNARARERARLDAIPDWKREAIPGPRKGAACSCGYHGSGLFNTGKGWRCWACMIDNR